MTDKTEYAFVTDAAGKKLSPAKAVKAWYKIRKKQAVLVNRYPMVIQLKRIIPDDEICKDETRCGIDDGGLHTGIAIVQKCQSKNKVLLKGTLEHRNDVKKKMTARRGYRRYRRNHKRYRPARFNNRSSSKRAGRIAPSILQKRQSVIRVMTQLNKWINITSYWLEDVAIDTRALTDGYKPYGWQYQKSNRLDENIRKAVILRDGCKCIECGKTNCILEVHHIKPKRLNGPDTLNNLIKLCGKCHDRTENKEELYMDKYFSLIKGSCNTGLNYAQHVMIGKTWLRDKLSSIGTLHLTTGGDTANKRIDWDIEKTHPNDAICITGLYPDTINIKEWCIKPMRRKSKAKTDNVLGIKHRDLVEYTFRNGETHRGYVTALYPELHSLNFQSPAKHCKKVNAKKCRLLWKFKLQNGKGKLSMNISDIQKYQKEYEKFLKKSPFQSTIEKICKDITDQKNNAMAMEFIRVIGGLLRENGVYVHCTETKFSEKTTHNSIEEKYGIKFDSVDFSEHDKEFTGEIKKLKSEVEKYQKAFEDAKKERDCQITKYQKKIEELTAENKKLKGDAGSEGYLEKMEKTNNFYGIYAYSAKNLTKDDVLLFLGILTKELVENGIDFNYDMENGMKVYDMTIKRRKTVTDFLPTEPIAVAAMFINAEGEYKHRVHLKGRF